ncbi:MAG TPA: hypothetical protein VFS06_03505 [Casimicrobiaceae bacterium]|nr:hypothetical protein [Casimicrobiaceae bacterium]
MMLSIGLVLGAVVAGPLGFVLGCFAARDRRTERVHVMTPTLRRMS